MPYEIINNHKIYYEESGEGNPILFIHGLGSSSKDWEKQIPFFAKFYKTINIDLRGHGQTEGSKGPYSISGFASDASGFLHKETKALTIVGISMGGMIAFQMAIDHPKLVKNLVIINSFAEVSLKDKKTRRALRKQKIIPRILGMKIMGKIIAKRLFPKENQNELRKIVIERWAKNSVKDYVKSVNALAGWSIKKHLPSIKCPVLVVGAEHDYTSMEEKQAYTDQIPNGKLVMIPDSHHAVSFEKPDELNDIVFRFLES